MSACVHLCAIFGNGVCTSGIPAYNAKRARGYFTAGHCYKAGQSVYSTGNSKSGVYYTGRVTHNFGYPEVDAEFISGARYTGKILSSTSLYSAKPIVGVYQPTPSPHHRVCFTGSTSGTKCDNHVTVYSGRYCSEEVCHKNLMTLMGGTSSQRGDSGGAVFANFGSSVKVTGIISGYKNPWIGQSTTFVQPWSRIARTYKARLMTN